MASEAPLMDCFWSELREGVCYAHREKDELAMQY